MIRLTAELQHDFQNWKHSYQGEYQLGTVEYLAEISIQTDEVKRLNLNKDIKINIRIL